MERDRISQLTDLANAVRYANNGTPEQFSSYIERMMRIAS